VITLLLIKKEKMDRSVRVVVIAVLIYILLGLGIGQLFIGNIEIKTIIFWPENLFPVVADLFSGFDSDNVGVVYFFVTFAIVIAIFIISHKIEKKIFKSTG